MMSSNVTKTTTELFEVSAHEIVRKWKRSFGIDVSELFYDVETVLLKKDLKTGLEFFDPPIAGDEKLYAELQKFPWYYADQKWEFDRALSSMQCGSRLLEIGCGRGGFLQKAALAGHNCIGIELNSEAANAARTDKLDVRTQLLDEFLLQNDADFDRVFAFQVLEHVTDPVDLLEQMLAAIKPGGRVCFAVPNANSFLGEDKKNLLDMPPHHISRWRPESIKQIGDLLGVSRVIVEESPLEPIHFDNFLDVKFRGVHGRKLILNPVSKAAIRAILKTGLASKIRGHAVYAEYAK